MSAPTTHPPPPFRKPFFACFRFFLNFSPIFPGGSADPICPYVRTPMRSRTRRRIGDRAFSVTAPRAWNTAEATAVDHYFSSSTENVSVPVSLCTGNSLVIVLRYALGLPVGGAILVADRPIQCITAHKT